MKRILRSAALGAAMAVSVIFAAWADNSVRVRGTVTGLTADSARIETTAGETVSARLAPTLTMIEYVPIRIEDVPPSAFLAIVSAVQPDRSQRALALFVFPENMRGLGEGVRNWDLGPTSRMTNATVAQLVNRADGGREMTVRFGNTTLAMQITPQTTVMSIQPSDRSLLVVGARVVLFGERAPDGSISSGLVGIGRDGRLPPV